MYKRTSCTAFYAITQITFRNKQKEDCKKTIGLPNNIIQVFKEVLVLSRLHAMKTFWVKNLI